MIEGNCGAFGRIDGNCEAFWTKKDDNGSNCVEFCRKDAECAELEVILMVFRELGNYTEMS